MVSKTTYIGFFLDNETINKLKIISHITKEDRSKLLREGVEYIIGKNKDAFEKFAAMIEDMNK